MDIAIVLRARIVGPLAYGRSFRWNRAAILSLCLVCGGAEGASAQSAGVCGPANNQIASQPPTSGLCATGTPSKLNGQGPWSWTCSAPGLARDAGARCVALTTSGNTPIPDSRFDRYVKFYGDQRNRGTLATQARVNDVVTKTEQPLFMAGFFRPEEHPTWGMLVAIQSENRSDGTFALSTGVSGINLFEWRNGPFHTLAKALEVYRGIVKGRQPKAYVLNQWQFIAAVIKDKCNSQIFLEGVWSDPTPQCVPWPTGLSSTTFGSYYDLDKQQQDSHLYNGGLRDWAVVTGTPTTEELQRMRNGEDPRTIWGAARVWGYWNFTADPATGAKERDLTGHGHDLTYIGAGTDDPKKPSLILQGSVKPDGPAR